MKRLYPVTIGLLILFSLFTPQLSIAKDLQGTRGCREFYSTCNIIMVRPGLVNVDCGVRSVNGIKVNRWLRYNPNGNYEVRACEDGISGLKNVKIGVKLY